MHKTLRTTLILGVLAFPAAWAATNFGGNYAPSGAHYRNGFAEPVCTLDRYTVTCLGTQIGGVGNTDADISVSISYSGAVTCTNKGGNTVEVKTQNTATSVPPDQTTTLKNGTLTVEPVTFGGDPQDALERQAVCPNGHWTKDLQGDATVVSYSYSLTFEGFNQPAITITGP